MAVYHWRKLPQVHCLSRQNLCRDKHVFVTTKHIFCRDESLLVATKLLSLQNYVCCDKYLSWQTFCRDKCSVAPHIFVATKIILVADPANDSSLLSLGDAHSVWLRDLANTGVSRGHSRLCPAYVESEPALLNTTELTRQECSVSFGRQPTNDLTSPPVVLWGSYVYCVCARMRVLEQFNVFWRFTSFSLY